MTSCTVQRRGGLDEFLDFCVVDLGLSRSTALLYRSKVSQVLGALGESPTAESFRKFLKPLDRGYANNYIKAARAYFRDFLGHIRRSPPPDFPSPRGLPPIDPSL